MRGSMRGLVSRRRRGESRFLAALRNDRQKAVAVVKMEGWTRGEFFDETGVKWVNPSPNLRSVEEAVLYPGVGMLDFANVSVGRGTAMPFEVFGAGVRRRLRRLRKFRPGSMGRLWRIT